MRNLDNLNKLGMALYEQFLADKQDRGGNTCTCFISPLCSWCTHEGNPRNLQESKEYWMTTIEQQTEDAKYALEVFIDLLTKQAHLRQRISFDIAHTEHEMRMIDMYEDFGVPYVKLQ